MTRRAFTILELTLATATGSMMVLACLALFAALGKHEKLLAARTADTGACERTHLVIQRALETMLMVGDVAPKQPPLERARDVPTDEEEPGAVVNNAGPARFILGPDPAGLTLASPRPGAPAESDPVTYPAQTLELVLPAHPVKPAARGRQGRAMLVGRARPRSEPEPPREDPEEWRPGDPLEPAAPEEAQSARGMFELRPSPVRSPREAPGYSLWWRPVERPQNPEDPEAAPAPSSLGPVELISGLAWARWSVYQGRQWREAHEASYVEHLPAYVRFHARTVNGYDIDWLFEIRWLIGAEFEERPPPGAGGGVDALEEGGGGAAEETGGGAAGGGP